MTPKQDRVAVEFHAQGQVDGGRCRAAPVTFGDSQRQPDQFGFVAFEPEVKPRGGAVQEIEHRRRD